LKGCDREDLEASFDKVFRITHLQNNNSNLDWWHFSRDRVPDLQE
jgi:hypothetical protein